MRKIPMILLVTFLILSTLTFAQSIFNFGRSNTQTQVSGAISSQVLSPDEFRAQANKSAQETETRINEQYKKELATLPPLPSQTIAPLPPPPPPSDTLTTPLPQETTPSTPPPQGITPPPVATAVPVPETQAPVPPPTATPAPPAAAETTTNPPSTSPPSAPPPPEQTPVYSGFQAQPTDQQNQNKGDNNTQQPPSPWKITY